MKKTEILILLFSFCLALAITLSDVVWSPTYRPELRRRIVQVLGVIAGLAFGAGLLLILSGDRE